MQKYCTWCAELDLLRYFLTYALICYFLYISSQTIAHLFAGFNVCDVIKCSGDLTLSGISSDIISFYGFSITSIVMILSVGVIQRKMSFDDFLFIFWTLMIIAPFSLLVFIYIKFFGNGLVILLIVAIYILLSQLIRTFTFKVEELYRVATGQEKQNKKIENDIVDCKIINEKNEEVSVEKIKNNFEKEDRKKRRKR